MVKGLKDSNTYYGVQVGYDKAAANGWHTGVAFDYRNGDSNYLLGGKGDNQMYSLGVYGVKKLRKRCLLPRCQRRLAVLRTNMTYTTKSAA